MAINAIRLRTIEPPDGQGRYRYLQAVNGGGAGLFAVRVASPAQWETFLFEPPTTFPLASGAQLSMNLCNSNWDPSGNLVRVSHGTHTSQPSNKKDPALVTYEIGGPGQSVWVVPASYLFSRFPDDPMDRIFNIVKIVNGNIVGGQINNGDAVSLRINSNLGKTFFFHVDGADMCGDGTAAGQADTTFVVEFVEARSGLGVCGVVDGTVTRAAGGQVIAGALVEALNLSGSTLFSTTTLQNGTYILPPDPVSMCIPGGNIKVRASANRFKTKTIDPVVVPGGGSVNVPIQLDCTQVKVKVVDSANLGMPGVTVMLLDTSNNVLRDLNGQAYIGNTGLDGSVTFNCVPHGNAKAQATTTSDTQVEPVNVPPDGATVTIIMQNTCGNLVGKIVTDIISQTGIPNVTVTIAGTSLQTTTNANGDFRFNCVKPAGQKTVLAVASGCVSNTGTATVPTSGDLQQVVITLNCAAVVVESIVAILQWAAQPSDLDAHLSGPDGMGGRFHLFFGNRALPPVPYASLSTDDTSAFGPEVLTITKSAGVFVAGDYHVWVHNFVRSTFTGSSAVVTVVRMDPQNVPTQVSRQEVQFATGDPADDIWHVVNLNVDPGGNVTVTVVQTLIGVDPANGQLVSSATVL